MNPRFGEIESELAEKAYDFEEKNEKRKALLLYVTSIHKMIARKGRCTEELSVSPPPLPLLLPLPRIHVASDRMLLVRIHPFTMFVIRNMIHQYILKSKETIVLLRKEMEKQFARIDTLKKGKNSNRIYLIVIYVGFFV